MREICYLLERNLLAVIILLFFAPFTAAGELTQVSCGKILVVDKTNHYNDGLQSKMNSTYYWIAKNSNLEYSIRANNQFCFGTSVKKFEFNRFCRLNSITEKKKSSGNLTKPILFTLCTGAILYGVYAIRSR